MECLSEMTAEVYDAPHFLVHEKGVTPYPL